MDHYSIIIKQQLEMFKRYLNIIKKDLYDNDIKDYKLPKRRMILQEDPILECFYQDKSSCEIESPSYVDFPSCDLIIKGKDF